MGSPLAPTLANFFLGHIEKKLMSNCNDEVKPKLYVRYVDDIFVVFSSSVDYKPFFDILNAQHSNLRFTVELGDKDLTFLDTQVSIENGNFESWVYRKPTNTHVILNQCALCPMEWKKGLVKCFLHRAWTICSNYKRLHEEIVILRDIFVRNGYAVSFFDRIVNRFLIKKFTQGKFVNVSSDDKEDEPVFLKRYILKVPYIGKASIHFKRKITELVQRQFDVKLSCVYSSCKIRDYFSLKCKSHPFLVSNVVYKFTCQSDSDQFYIGETARHIGTRAGEHLDLSRTNPTAVAKHIKDCETCFNCLELGMLSYENFEIMCSGQSKFDIEVKEAMLIKRSLPTLNRHLYRDGSIFSIRIFN